MVAPPILDNKHASSKSLFTPRAARVRILCLAHVTDKMGLAGDDFEKAEARGTTDALTVLEATIAALRPP